jgi:ubiquinone/menaquinone biosynthesis C-methylase UbiE
MNAEHTSFPDGHFDMVVSHILLHETSWSALRNIFAECYRLLSPGGYMMHAEVPQYEGLDPFTQFMLDYDTYYNNEPFWGAMHDTDLLELAREVGFAAENVFTEFVASGRKEGSDRTGKVEKGKPAGQLQLTVARR